MKKFFSILIAFFFLPLVVSAEYEVVDTVNSNGIKGTIEYDAEQIGQEYKIRISNVYVTEGYFISYQYGFGAFDSNNQQVSGVTDGDYMYSTGPGQIIYETYISDTENTLKFLYFNAEVYSSGNVINNINISGFTAPKYGETVDREISSSTSGIKNVSIEWINSNGAPYTDDTFIDGSYSAYITVTTEDNFVLSIADGEWTYGGVMKLNNSAVSLISDNNISFDLHQYVFALNYTVDKKLMVSIDNSLSSVTNNNVTIGDTVTLKMKINTNSPLDYVTIHFTRPITKEKTKDYYLSYNSESGLWETTFTIDNNWENGKYMIDYLYYSSSDRTMDPYNGIFYNRENPNSAYYGKVNEHNTIMNNMEFTVYGTDADITKPVIDGSTLTVSDRQVIPGDRVKYAIKVTDDRAVKRVEAQIYYASASYTYKYVNMEYNDSTGLYEGYLNIDEDLPVGLWYVNHIYAVDENSNGKFLYNSSRVSYGDYKYNWPDNTYTIYNYGSNVTTNIEGDLLIRNETTVTKGGNFNVNFNASNPLGINTIQFFYKIDGYENEIVYDANYVQNEFTNTSSLPGVPLETNRYEMNIDFGQYGPNGYWDLNRIVITDNRGGITEITNDTILSNGDFTTVDFIDDSVAPDYQEVSLDKRFAYLNEKVTFSVKVTDDASGVNRVLINCNGKEYKLNKNGDYYIYEFNFDDISKSGRYVIDHMTLIDNANNYHEVTAEDLGENMSFVFAGPIKIVAPSKYLSPTTSYSLKAISVPGGEAIEGLTWSSSDTSLLSINSTTGVVSTKSREGNVTVTARSSNGEYATIDFIVTGAVVYVGQKHTLGNSTYVGYSEVVWEIEDETILSRTGRYTKVSINNSYKHGIEVLGLKKGSTRLKMLTPAGDVLASSIVYVEDKITNIQASVSNLNMHKGDEVDLNYDVVHQSGEYTKEVTIVSEDSNVVTVDQMGHVVAVGGGTTNIAIYADYYSTPLRIPVTVTVLTNEITVDSDNISLSEGNKTHQIVYEVKPSDATDKAVIFTSSNSGIATVSETGLITALRNGNVTITIAANDGGASKTINVSVTGIKKELENLEFEEIPDVTYTGSSLEPTLVIKDEDGYYLVKDVDYTAEYSNNINVGTGNVTVTGINTYKGTKELTFNIKKAEQSLTYNAYDQTYTYDGKGHGITIEYSGTIKYANDNDEYVLDDMPKYINAGTYTIKFALIEDDNHEIVYGSNKVIINKAQYDIGYEGNDISLSFQGDKVDKDSYNITYTYESVDYNQLFNKVYTDATPRTLSNTLPSFDKPGKYSINYYVTSDNFETVDITKEIVVIGMGGYDKKVITIKDGMMAFKKKPKTWVETLDYINFFMRESTACVGTGYDVFKTGSVYEVLIDETLKITYPVVIFGDVNGDGEITPLDYVRIKNHIMETTIIKNKAQKLAADYNEDNQISPLDYVKVKNYIMNGGN